MTAIATEVTVNVIGNSGGVDSDGLLSGGVIWGMLDDSAGIKGATSG
jgi:hypothetical protein